MLNMPCNRNIHAMFFSIKMLHNYIVWSSHGNITDGASIIPNFSHSQNFLLHNINDVFRYNFGLQQFFNGHVMMAHVVHPENLFYINQVHYYTDHQFCTSANYTFLDPSPFNFTIQQICCQTFNFRFPAHSARPLRKLFSFGSALY